MVVECDDICEGCKYLKNNSSKEVIDHRKDFRYKEEFNDFIDFRIMKARLINKDEALTPIQLCRKTRSYLKNILWIYEGNDLQHNRSRAKNVERGLNIYSERINQKHSIPL
jgi:hypothetical protein